MVSNSSPGLILQTAMRLPETCLFISEPQLTQNRPAMPFGNRKKYFRGSFQFSIVTKNITPLET